MAESVYNTGETVWTYKFDDSSYNVFQGTIIASYDQEGDIYYILNPTNEIVDTNSYKEDRIFTSQSLANAGLKAKLQAIVSIYNTFIGAL